MAPVKKSQLPILVRVRDAAANEGAAIGNRNVASPTFTVGWVACAGHSRLSEGHGER